MIDAKCRVDGFTTSKKLLLAAKGLTAASGDETGRELARAVALLGELEEPLARFRKLEELHRALVEVSALIAGGVEGEEVRRKAEMARRLADEVTCEVGDAVEREEQRASLA